tara:strand:- start:152 stop:781 length:630 start_codon:yes stop_codon:yes gene_type:complete
MIKKFVIFILLGFVSALFLVSFSTKLVLDASKMYINSQNKCDVAIVLGTSKFTLDKKENLFYANRIKKAVELYKCNKIKFIVVSGDNGKKDYDEPTQMKLDLIKAGVPSSHVYCDYAGFSTIDSMLRMKLIFKESKFIVISQKFHLERAIYIARKNGIEAFGEAAKDVPALYAPYHNYREKLARVKAVLEVLICKGPKFGGKPVLIKRI